MLFRKMRAKTIAAEKEIAKFKKDIASDIKRQKELNRVLSNGIVVKIYHATGGR